MHRLAALLVVLMAGTILAQDGGVLLQWKRGIGDRATVRISSELSMEVAKSDSEGEVSRTVSVRGSAEFKQAVLSVDGGEARKLRVECLRSVRQVALTEEETLLQGHTYVVTLAQPLSAVVSEDGSAVPPEAVTVGGWEFASVLMPGKEVSVGSSWKIPAQKVNAFLSLADLRKPAGEVDVKLESVSGSTANVSFSGTIVGEDKDDGTKIAVRITAGRVVMDIQRSAPLSISLEGEISMNKEIVEKQVKGQSIVEEDILVGKIAMKTKKLKVDVKFR